VHAHAPAATYDAQSESPHGAARVRSATGSALLATGWLGVASGGCTGSTAASADRERSTDRTIEAVAPCDSTIPGRAAATRSRLDVPFAVELRDTLRLDLELPAGIGPHPLVVLLHGGGWEGGHRSAMHGEMRVLASHGYAAATVSYRLTRGSRHVFPAAVQDVRCAVRWLRARADSLGVDAERVGALGFSAGAHLASMLGVAAAVPGLDGGSPSAAAADWTCLAARDESPGVQAVVSAAGPQDLRVNGPYTAEQARLVTKFLGAFPGDAPDRAALASPIAHVGPHAAPFLLVHGTRDDLVPIAHARRMRDALQAAGVPATVLEERGLGHAFPALDAIDRPRVGCTTLAFLDRWLRRR
jgi:acetyl esterase/lipase